MQVVSMKDIGGDIVKDNSVYLLKDNKKLNNLVLSSTFLRANQNTTGHKHNGQEEVYMFVSGNGEMEIDGKRFNVREGDCILIEDGEFHKVYNTGHLGLYFVCVFDGKRSH
jgi:mannose-6-phosphate isomerase-like protein (cupin superfamily)